MSSIDKVFSALFEKLLTARKQYSDRRLGESHPKAVAETQLLKDTLNISPGKLKGLLEPGFMLLYILK